MDFKYDRIYNGFIIFGIILGFFIKIYTGRTYDIKNSLAAMLISFCILYPIYKIGALGSGDVKLFIMAGSFISIGVLLGVIWISFIIGAFISVAKMLSEKNLKERMRYLMSYLYDVLCSGHWKLYGEDHKNDRVGYKSNKIHFSLPICLGVMIRIGGLF